MQPFTKRVWRKIIYPNKKRTCVTCSVLNWSKYLIKRLFKIEKQPTRSGHNHFILLAANRLKSVKHFYVNHSSL